MKASINTHVTHTHIVLIKYIKLDEENLHDLYLWKASTIFNLSPQIFFSKMRRLIEMSYIYKLF